LTADQIVARLESAQIAYARMNSVDQFVAHPQLSARGRWRDIGSPAGPLRALLPPAGLDDMEPVMGPVPALGQHSESILRELGFDAATIARWREERTI
jgi:itaconate CoA-transferase